MASKDEIRELSLPVLSAAGLELWDVEIEGRVLRVLVDGPTGVDLDRLAELSRAISRALDEHPELAPPGRYELEVSSPGLERKLHTPEQFERFLGDLVTVKTLTPVEGSRRVSGVLESVSAQELAIRSDDRPGSAPVHVLFDQIERAKTVFVWGPGKGERTPGSSKRREPAASAAGEGSARRKDGS